MPGLFDNLPPELLDYIRNAQNAKPPPEFDEAMAKDEEARQNAGLTNVFSRAAALVRNQPQLAPPLRSDTDSAMKAWAMRQGATKEAQAESLRPLETLAKFKGLFAHEKPGDRPAPPEWNAPQGMTVDEAIRAGYAHNAKPTDPLHGPVPENVAAALKAKGKDPSLYPTHGEALKALHQTEQMDMMAKGAAVVGPNGEIFVVPIQGHERGTAIPVGAPGGGALKKDKDLQPAEGEKLTALASEYRNMEGLLGQFKDQFAGKGMLGGLEVSGAQKLGSWGSKNQQALAQWWSDYQRILELPQRNQIFGASLTETEKKSWAAAQNIKPGSDPEVVRQSFATVMGIIKRKLQARGQSLIADGYSPQVISAATNGLVSGEGASETPAESPRPKRVRVDAEGNVIP